MVAAWWDEFFSQLKRAKGDVPKAIDRTALELDIGRKQFEQRVFTAKSRNPAFANLMRTVLAPLEYAGYVEPEFPKDDFLLWRELTCAYIHHRTKKVVRATNTWFHSDAYRTFKGNNRLVVILPPGHNKTTLYGVEMPSHAIQGDRDSRIAVVRKNQDEAKKLISAVQERLDTEYYDVMDERLRRQDPDAPKLVNPMRAWFADKAFKPGTRRTGGSWGADQFIVQGRTPGEKDPTMQAFGVGGAIQGGRFQDIILDDVQDPMDAKNPMDASRLLDWVEKVILGRITDDQRLVVCANFFAPDDFAHLLIREHPEFVVVNYPALIPRWRSLGKEEPEDDADMEDVPLWPEYWTVESLENKRKEVREQTWHFTWMQEEGGIDSQTFKRETLEASLVDDFRLGEKPHDVARVFIGCDPAQAASGHCAIVAWGLNRKTKQRYLIDVFNQAGMRHWDNVVDKVTEMASLYQANYIIIERRNTQGSIMDNPRYDRQMRATGAKILDYKPETGSGAASEHTNFDITTIGALFDAGLISLPGGGTFEEMQRVHDYIDQLCNWRTDDQGRSIKQLKRDMVMATLFAESQAFIEANRPTEKKKQTGRRTWGPSAWGKKKVRDDDSDYLFKLPSDAEVEAMREANKVTAP